MPTIEDQLKLETEMVNRGVEAYKRAKETAIEKGRGAETGFARRLMDEYIQPLTEELDRIKNIKSGPGVRARANVHLRNVDSDKAIFLALRAVFNAYDDKCTATAIANNVGRMIEDEIRFNRFREKYAKFYHEIILDFKRKGTKDYRYMHRVLTHAANANGDGWTPWAVTERIDVGMRLLDVILRTTDLIEKETYFKNGKTIIQVRLSDQTAEFVNQYDEMAQLLEPRCAPCIIPPDPWTGYDQGGYYSPELRMQSKMVITRHPKHRKMIRQTEMPLVLSALNSAQSVAWKVNHKVLDVARTVWAKNLGVGMPNSEKLQPSESPFPDKGKENMTQAELAMFLEWKRHASETYTKERERQGKAFQATAILRAANEYNAYEAFWFVWVMDFRGRMYTTTAGFSPQGPDLAKGMLVFRNGKALGERGVFWLKVHGANRFGYDKVDYPDRVKWVDDNHKFFMATATDPLGNIEVWSKADKPYQFLAFIFEYAEMMSGALVGKKPEEYVSHLPIGLDGSCNGLQHFSAMLRDEKGGKATNLIPSDLPNDIYGEVGQVCLGHVKVHPEPVMREWERFADIYGAGKLPRKIPKRPVMTQPYGSTQQSCTQYIYEAAQEFQKGFFTVKSDFLAASALTPLMWRSIGEVVVAAREAMDWLKKCASVNNKANKGITWRTHDGFIVHMFERKRETARIDTVLNGRLQTKVGNVTDELDPYGQRSGVSPNFVHSHDASHLRATVRKAVERGVTDLALIHDDYGTHAANTDILHRCIREAFVEQYEQFDPINSFAEWQHMITKMDMPEQPARGNLDVKVVLDSKFFFG